MSFYSTYEELLSVCEKSADVRNLAQVVDCGIRVKVENQYFLDYKNPYRKSDDVVVIRQNRATGIASSKDDDREFPLDTLAIQKYRNEHQDRIETATIHTGPYADEFTRSLNALAVTVATDIFFRNGAYRPESEEGRQILAHELTHVNQYQENAIPHEGAYEELEAEAEHEEIKERREDNPYRLIRSRGKLYKIRK